MRSEILLTQCEIWLRHVKSAYRRVIVGDCEDVGTQSVPLFMPKAYKERQKAPPLAGELLSVSEAEGEHLAALGIFKPHPFRLLISFAATFPISWGQLLDSGSTQKAPRPGSCRRSRLRG